MIFVERNEETTNFPIRKYYNYTRGNEFNKSKKGVFQNEGVDKTICRHTRDKQSGWLLIYRVR